MTPTFDTDGCPSEPTLEYIRTCADISALVEVVKAAWWMPESGIEEEGDTLTLHTLGWSGNESVIAAMEQNFVFWSRCWMRSERGGHYTFRIPRSAS